MSVNAGRERRHGFFDGRKRPDSIYRTAVPLPARSSTGLSGTVKPTDTWALVG